MDDRLRVFLTDPMEVFHSVEHRHEIWKDDPFDVSLVHAEARETFDRLLAQVTTPPGAPSGRILLLLGPSGAGKTHLIRAFRSDVHKNRAGYVAYMQMTSTSSNYARYVLSNLIDSLDQPYDEAVDTRTGLVRIAAVLASRAFEPKISGLLRDDPDLEDDDITDLVHTGADRLIAQDRYKHIELDILRAFLYLYRPDPRIKGRIFKYLRCEDLSPHDLKLLGAIQPWNREEHAEKMIEQIGRLIGILADTPLSLVFCLDELEGMYELEASAAPLRRALGTVRDLAERLPSSIFVVCCMEEVYDELKQRLPGSLLDRIQRDPAPVRLQVYRTIEEAKLLVAARLEHLYASAGVSLDEVDPLYPFPASFFAERGQLRTRDVLESCRAFRERCRKAGKLVELPTTLEAPPPPPNERVKALAQWEGSWNEFLAESKDSPPEEDDELAKLLAWAITCAGEELETGHRFRTTAAEGAVRVVTSLNGLEREHLYVGLCNRTPQFGWLARQIAQHTKKAQSDSPAPVLVLARSDDFPTAKTVQKEIAVALGSGGRRVVIQNADWRSMLALRRFRAQREAEPFFTEWLAEENHLSRLGSVRALLDLDHLERFEKVSPEASESSSVAPRAAEPASPSPSTRPPTPVPAPPSPLNAVEAPAPDALLAGVSAGLLPQPVTLRPAEITCHTAFLGGSGSGKTTLALSLIEQLLVRGTPVLMLDRKGDLAGYARSEGWGRPLSDGALDDRRKKLLSGVDVALFTPGHPDGRPISITVSPDGLADLPSFEREEAATQSAQALGDMLGYKHGGRDGALRAVLIQALQVLAQIIDRPIGLDILIPFIGDADPALVAAVGRLDTKLFAQLVQNLETLKITATQLFAPGGEPLDVDLLLGRGAHARAGRTQLTIISTKFLRDDAQIHFWVAQLLLALLRWGSRNPKNELQAALLFDEADLYLPAMRQPATKAPMESLLKRGRSAGLGVMLATQSPGDLDYRCRDTVRAWFLGRIKEQTALQKLKPMLSESPVDVMGKLPGQETGEFHLVREGKVTHLRAHRSVLATEQLSDAELLILARRTLETKRAY